MESRKIVMSTPPYSQQTDRLQHKKKLRQQLDFRQVFKLLTSFGDVALSLRSPRLTGSIR